jgi:hypothetical protein
MLKASIKFCEPLALTSLVPLPESTKKRHEYYCRSKLTSDAPARKAACETCVKAKARCDRSVPQCYRCQQRNIVCTYTNKAEISSNSSSQRQTDIALLERSSSSQHLHDFASGSTEILTPFGAASAYLRDTNRDLRRRQQPLPRTRNSLLTPLSIATVMKPSNAFAHRFEGQPGRDLVALFLSSLLKEYRDGMLPPFVHWSQRPSETQQPINSLGTCRLLVCRFFSALPAERMNIWPQIQQEAERIWFNHNEFDNWELLGSIQSMLIYTLLRATQARTHPPIAGFDLPFLICFNHVSQAMSKIAGTQEQMQAPGSTTVSSPDFHTWVLYEARKRIVVMFRLLNMVVDISDAVSCFPLPGFVIIPLPESEAQWCTTDPNEWSSLFSASCNVPSVFGMSTQGQLVKLQKDGVGISRSQVDWSDWCVAGGKLGYALAAAATLLHTPTAGVLDALAARE